MSCLEVVGDVGYPVALGPLADEEDPLTELRKTALEHVGEYNGYAKQYNDIVKDHKLDVDKLELLTHSSGS